MEREVFVCHSSRDAATAQRLCDRLESSGIGCWIAPRDVLAGVSYPRQIVEAIQGSRVLLLVYSAASDCSQHVQRELETALQENVSILPFRLDAHEPSEDMRYFLGAQHWVHATAPDPDPGEQRLAEQVGALLNRIRGRVPPKGKGTVPGTPTALASEGAASGTAAPSSSRVARRLEALYRDAEDCEALRDFADAAAAYERILALAPEDADAKRLLALARLEMGGDAAAGVALVRPSPRTAAAGSAGGALRVVPGEGPSLEDVLAAAGAERTVQLVAGRHRLRQPLSLDKALTLVGEGRERTAIVCDGESFVLRFKGTGRLVLRDLALVHEGSADADVLRVAGGAVVARQCAFRGAVASARADDDGEQGGDGVWVTGDATAEFRECEFDHNARHGLFADKAGCLTVEDGVVADCGGGGILLLGKARGVLRRNAFRGNGGSGILFRGDTAGDAEGNACECNAKSGIYVDDHAAPSLRENICTGNGDSGIAYFGDGGGTCESNRCERNRGNGIYVGERAAPTVAKNVCAENDKDGISYRNEAGGHCAGNRCRNNKEDGIYIASGATVRLQGNVCLGNGGAGVNDCR